MSRTQPRCLITFSQTRRQLALAFEPLGDVLDRHNESGNRVIITQGSNCDSLLHLVETPGGRHGSTRNEVMMKSCRQYFHDAFTQRSLKAFQESARVEIRNERSQRLTRSRFLTDAGES